MNIYKTPKSNVYIENTAKECGICPFCEGKVSNWAIAKPSIRPNKIKCNNCSKFIKLAYPKFIFITIQLFAVIVSLLFAYISFYLAFSFVDYEGDYMSSLIKLLSLFTVISIIVVTLMLGFIEAWLFKYRYPFQVW